MRKSFIKSLLEQELTLGEKLEEWILYSRPVIFLRQIGRFLHRLPSWLRVCWKSEDWESESLYYFLEMQLGVWIKAQQEDTWHTGTKRRERQAKICLEHLKRYMNPFDYYPYPDTELAQVGEYKGSPTYSHRYKTKKDEITAKYYHQHEEYHFHEFWKLLVKHHTGWWT